MQFKANAFFPSQEKKQCEFKQKTANSLTHGESWSCMSSTKRGGCLFLRQHETFGGCLNSVVWHITTHKRGTLPFTHPLLQQARYQESELLFWVCFCNLPLFDTGIKMESFTSSLIPAIRFSITYVQL